MDVGTDIRLEPAFGLFYGQDSGTSLLVCVVVGIVGD